MRLLPEECSSFKGKEVCSRKFSELWIGSQNHGEQKKKTRKEFSVNAQEKQRLGLIGIVRTKLDKAEN